jgi:hypothetical protein
MYMSFGNVSVRRSEAEPDYRRKKKDKIFRNITL